MRMSESSDHGKSTTEHRILVAAASLFGSLGYNGVSTRDIASAAEVNEATIYRHFPRKRDLYLAVLATELGRVSLRGDLLDDIARAENARKALTCTYRLISTTMARQPQLMRLVLYSSLELKPDLDQILQRHLGELVEVVAGYLEPWITSGDLRYKEAKGLILALISIVIFHWPLGRLFSAEPIEEDAAFQAFSEMCLDGVPVQDQRSWQGKPP